jgi:3-oxoacyl-[acyl-carrier protein] reductase
VAERLAADGLEVVAVDVDGGSAEATAEAVGGSAHACDVADRGSVEALAAELGPVDVLVNNAGIWRHGDVLDQPQADVDQVLAVNLLGTLWCCRAFRSGLAQGGGGSIVNFSSAAAAMRAGGLGSYSVSKGAIEVLTQQLAGELGAQRIRVNAVAPGLIVTEGTAGSYDGDRQARRARAVPLGRVGRPADVANVVSFLVSDESSYVSGQIIAVDGGITAARPAT